MIRTLFVAVAFALLCLPSLGQVNLAVTGIGLNDYNSTSPQALTLTLNNLSSKSGVYELDVQIRSNWGSEERIAGHFRSSVRLDANETRQVEFPIALAQYSNQGVRVLLLDSNGREIARREVKTNDFSGSLIAALCDEKLPQCTSVWSSILGSGNDEQTDRKQKKLNFIAPRVLGTHFWNYTPARYLVLARPAQGLRQEVRNGIEQYIRRGGVLIWCDREAGTTDWLAKYRSGEHGQARSVGAGWIYTVPDSNSPLLAQLFNRETNPESGSTQFPNNFVTGYGGYGGFNFDTRNSTHFDFPSLKWLLLWLLAYIVVAGAINFAVLRKTRKLEWGWVTVPLISILFAVLMYFMSSAQRPTQIVLDQTATYIMDPLSPLAAANYSLRVSSPRKVSLTVSAPPEVVWNLGTKSPYPTAGDIARELFDRGSSIDAYELRYGARSEYPVSLLRWSFEDVSLSGMRAFSGSVVQLSPTRLRNETGVDFSSSIYVDPGSERVYTLGKFPSGSEVDLERALHEGLQSLINMQSERWRKQKGRVPYDLAEVLTSGTRANAFYGVAEGPALGATLKEVAPVQHSKALFIVVMK